MSFAVSKMKISPDYVFVDGNKMPKFKKKVEAETIIKGDSKVLSIAAASIIAKVIPCFFLIFCLSYYIIVIYIL